MGKVPRHTQPHGDIIIGPHTNAPAGRNVAGAAFASAAFCDVDRGCSNAANGPRPAQVANLRDLQ
eukprot:15484842-Alexandrium_andersonii.AAC.1